MRKRGNPVAMAGLDCFALLAMTDNRNLSQPALRLYTRQNAIRVGREIIKRVIAVLALLMATASQATPTDDLNSVISDHWKWWLSVNPVSATALGVRDHDDRIRDISLASRDRDAVTANGFLTRLNAIPDDGLAPPELTNKGVLARMFK